MANLWKVTYTYNLIVIPKRNFSRVAKSFHLTIAQKNIVYTSNLTTCQQDMFALLVPSCSQVWNKLRNHLVTKLMRPTDSQQVVPKSLHVTGEL
jgi:hypothetical protein